METFQFRSRGKGDGKTMGIRLAEEITAMVREVASVESAATNQFVPVSSVVEEFIRREYRRWKGWRNGGNDKIPPETPTSGSQNSSPADGKSPAPTASSSRGGGIQVSAPSASPPEEEKKGKAPAGPSGAGRPSPAKQ